MSASTPSNGFYVDVRPILDAFNPYRSYSHYYTTFPLLRKVVGAITVNRIIECVFVLPAHDLQENGMTGVLYEYIEHQCPSAMDVLCDNTDVLFNFDCLVNDIVEAMDILLRQILAYHTNHYEKYVFDHWAADGLAAFLRYENES